MNIAVRKNAFRIEKFQAEFFKKLQIVLQDYYGLQELIVSSIDASPDLKSIKIFIMQPLNIAESQQIMFDALKMMFIEKFDSQTWDRKILKHNFNSLLLEVLQIFSKEIAHHISQIMFMKRCPNLFFKFANNFHNI